MTGVAIMDIAEGRTWGRGPVCRGAASLPDRVPGAKSPGRRAGRHVSPAWLLRREPYMYVVASAYSVTEPGCASASSTSGARPPWAGCKRKWERLSVTPPPAHTREPGVRHAY